MSSRHLTRGTLCTRGGNSRKDGLENSVTHMKASRYFKPNVLTGFVALGLMAAEVGRAQAPSGPITAAPAQPAHGPESNAQNPAPLPPPRTTILGAWKFNPDDSDDPRNRRQDSQDSNGGYGGGRGRMGGGYPGGGHGGYGGRRGGGESDEQRQKMRDLLTPARAITFSMTGAEVDLVDDGDRKQAFMTDGRKLQKSKDGNYQEIAAKFDGNRLATDEKDPLGNKMSRTFELSYDGRHLYETLHMTSAPTNTPLFIPSVYNIPFQPPSQ